MLTFHERQLPKQIQEEVWHFTFLQISLTSGLIEDNCVLMSAAAFNLLVYVNLVQFIKKIQHHKDI